MNSQSLIGPEWGNSAKGFYVKLQTPVVLPYCRGCHQNDPVRPNKNAVSGINRRWKAIPYAARMVLAMKFMTRVCVV